MFIQIGNRRLFEKKNTFGSKIRRKKSYLHEYVVILHFLESTILCLNYFEYQA